MKRAALAVLALAACAHPEAPPGGPPDTDQPRLLRVQPDSGQVNVKPKDVVFAFDEVISETPKGAADLGQLILVSPSDGTPEWDWHRRAITVHPRHGWKPNTAYVVTLLPGVADLRGNARDTATVVVFSTGGSIPQTRITGAVFDWVKAVPVPHAYVFARSTRDTTLMFTTEADSTGRFVLPFLAPAEYLVRAVIDANKNRVLDPREAWDSVTVTLADTASREFYTFAHDTIGPRMSIAAAADSMTVHLTFDQPLKPGVPPRVEIFLADSTPVAIAAIRPWPEIADLKAKAAKARADSIAAADTSTAARAARDRATIDSINRAAVAADSIARDTTRHAPPLVANRPAVASDVGVLVAKPLVPGTRYRVRATATGLLGVEKVMQRTFEMAKPPADPKAVPRRDTTNLSPPRPPPPS